MKQLDEVEVLLVEDNPHDAELTLRALKKHNLANQVHWVRDGAEVLKFIFAQGAYAGRDINRKPRLMLLDLKLPKVDGPEVLRQIKLDPRTRAIPVVILTSSHEDRDLDECYRLGANSYIVKPVEFEAFLKAVAEIGFYWLLLNKNPLWGGGGRR
jgi:two-component system response regulator